MIYMFFLSILLGIIFQKSKPIAMLQLIVSGTIFSFNTENPDYSGYFGTYNSIREGGIYWDYFQRYDPLYKATAFLCSKFGFSFNSFRLVLFTIFSIVLVYTIIKMTDRISFVISIYMIFPFIMDCIQIRNMMGAVFVFFAMRFLFVSEENSKKNSCIIKYILSILVAALFHYIAIVYLVFVIVLFPKIFKKVYALAIVSTVLFTYFMYTYDERLKADTGYFNTNISVVSFVFLVGVTILIMLLSINYEGHRYIRINAISNELDERVKRFAWMCTIFMPIVIFHFDLFRFLRNVLIVFTCLASQRMTDKGISRFKSYKVINWPNCMISLALVVSFFLLLWRSAYYPYDISLVKEIIGSIDIHW